MPDQEKQIERLMDDVLSIVGNKIANLKLLAEKATHRPLTEHEFESMRTQVDLCKPLIKERFLVDLISPAEVSNGSQSRSEKS